SFGTQQCADCPSILRNCVPLLITPVLRASGGDPGSAGRPVRDGARSSGEYDGVFGTIRIFPAEIIVSPCGRIACSHSLLGYNACADPLRSAFSNHKIKIDRTTNK
ncbi:MAG: hypothetical protein ACKVX9_08870, partial [Blastocatellia bacterium]